MHSVFPIFIALLAVIFIYGGLKAMYDIYIKQGPDDPGEVA